MSTLIRRPFDGDIEQERAGSGPGTPVDPASPGCRLPSCTALAPHSQHLFHEPESPLALRWDREGVSMWLPDGLLIWRKQPDALAKLRSDLAHWREGAVTRP